MAVMASISSHRAEVEDRDVLLDALGVTDFGSRCCPTRYASAAPLGRRAAVLGGDPGDDPVAEDLALAERRPRLGGDALAREEGAQRCLGETGVQLHLVEHGDHLGLGPQAPYLLLGEVREPIARTRPSWYSCSRARQVST